MNEPQNYELAPLQALKTNILLNADEREAGFIIALATVYNDIKDFFWMFQALLEGQPTNPDEISPTNGQFNGQMNFLIRNLIGVFLEFLVLIEENADVLERESLKFAESRITGNAISYWQELKRLALRQELEASETAVYNSIKVIRNSVSYHYFGIKNYLGGFKNYCDARGADSRIYASIGDRMETTRFYFADAATQYRLRQILHDRQVSDSQVMEFIKKMNAALRFFLESYLSGQDALFNGNRETRKGLAKLRGLET